MNKRALLQLRVLHMHGLWNLTEKFFYVGHTLHQTARGWDRENLRSGLWGMDAHG